MSETAAARSRPGFLGQLFAGRLRWDLLAPFPAQHASDRDRGDAVAAEMCAFLRAHVDPAQVEASGALPGDYVDGLRAHGLLNLQPGPELGGRGLSFFNVMRVIEAAMSWCMPAGYVLALQNGFGVGAVLPVIPDGPTRDYVKRRIAAGAVSGWADTEPAGAGNTHMTTTATPADGGYVLTGEKVFIVNGSIADLLVVSAALERGDRKETQVFFVDTKAPGFRVRMIHELMGLRGLPIAALTLDRVHIPAEAMLVTAEPHWRDTPLLEPISSLARMYVIVAASQAVGKQCNAWAAEFLARRSVDGQQLAEYEAIRRLVAENAAELFAMESVAHASLIGLDHQNLATRWFEQVAAKNLASLGCGRIVDRTMSLMSAEGYETAPSKARRGAPAVPLERALRDARAFRIAGGVDFLIDYYAVRNGLLPMYDEGPAEPAATRPDDARLSRRNAAHLALIADEVLQLGQTCRELVRRCPELAELHRRQRTLILLGQIAHELFAMTATLARAAARADDESQALADVYCATARHRVRAWVLELAAEPDPGLADSISACLDPLVAQR
jgi:alkylation response protein AidB-like acyl-CoA dehydrogenase